VEAVEKAAEAATDRTAEIFSEAGPTTFRIGEMETEGLRVLTDIQSLIGNDLSKTKQYKKFIGLNLCVMVNF
jgi:hypothetical protein